MRGNEIVDGNPKNLIRVYDDGGKTGDRYTVVYMNRKDYGYSKDYKSPYGKLLYPCLGMSASPFHPQGIGQHSDCVLGPHLGTRIPFASLPEDCQKAVKQDLGQ